MKSFFTFSLIFALSLGVNAQQPTPERPFADLEDWRLIQRSEKAQHTAFRLYNKYNDDNFYDVPCTREAVTGSRLTTKRCRPQFVDKLQLLVGGSVIDVDSGSEGRAGDVPLISVSNEQDLLNNATVFEKAYGELGQRISQLRSEHEDLEEAFSEYEQYFVEAEYRRKE